MADAESRLDVRRIAYPVSTLGYGRRVALWTQGCSIRCTGCVVPESWPRRRRGEAVETITAVLAPLLARADGLTISGGEPFDQAGALRALLEGLRDRFRGDILVFSGYAWRVITERWPWCRTLVDVLISEPYDDRAGQTLVLRGSDNQRIHLLSALSRERYPRDIDAMRAPERRSMHAFQDWDGDVFLAGIPRPGMRAALARAMARRGYTAT